MALKIHLRGEGCSRAHLARVRWVERGGYPEGSGGGGYLSHGSDRSPARIVVLQKETGLKCWRGPRRAHAGVRTGAESRCAAASPSPLLPRQGKAPHAPHRAGHTVPVPGMSPRYRAHRPGPRAKPSPVRGGLRAILKPTPPPPPRPREPSVEKKKKKKTTALHRSDHHTLYSILFFFKNKTKIRARLPSPVQTGGPPLPKILLYTKYIFVTKYNQ